MIFKSNRELKKEEDIKTLIQDLREAEELRELLFDKKQPLLKGDILSNIFDKR